jgi:hypothetical protein
VEICKQKKGRSKIVTIRINETQTGRNGGREHESGFDINYFWTTETN